MGIFNALLLLLVAWSLASLSPFILLALAVLWISHRSRPIVARIARFAVLSGVIGSAYIIAAFWAIGHGAPGLDDVLLLFGACFTLGAAYAFIQASRRKCG